MSTPLKKNRISKPSQSSQKPRNIKFISTDTSKLQAVSIAKTTSTHRKRGRPKVAKMVQLLFLLKINKYLFLQNMTSIPNL